MTQLWDDLRAQTESRRAARLAPWTPPEPGAFRPCKVLAFDPSLSSTGWVHLRIAWRWKAFPLIAVTARGTLRVRTDLTGYLGTYDKASRMKAMIEEVVWAEQSVHLPSAVAWEAPAVRGHRLESSLIAGFCVYEASNRAGTAVSANHASSLLTGSPLHDKREIAAAVARYVPESAGRTWNEHQRDALAIALSFSLDLPEPEPRGMGRRCLKTLIYWDGEERRNHGPEPEGRRAGRAHCRPAAGRPARRPAGP